MHTESFIHALNVYWISDARADDNHIPDQKHDESPCSVDQNVAYGMHSQAQLVPASSKTYHHMHESASMKE